MTDKKPKKPLNYDPKEKELGIRVLDYGSGDKIQPNQQGQYVVTYSFKPEDYSSTYDINKDPGAWDVENYFYTSRNLKPLSEIGQKQQRSTFDEISSYANYLGWRRERLAGWKQSSRRYLHQPYGRGNTS